MLNEDSIAARWRTAKPCRQYRSGHVRIANDARFRRIKKVRWARPEGVKAPLPGAGMPHFVRQDGAVQACAFAAFFGYNGNLPTGGSRASAHR
jgi:hypothetical protein